MIYTYSRLSMLSDQNSCLGGPLWTVISNAGRSTLHRRVGLEHFPLAAMSDDGGMVVCEIFLRNETHGQAKSPLRFWKVFCYVASSFKVVPEGWKVAIMSRPQADKPMTFTETLFMTMPGLTGFFLVLVLVAIAITSRHKFRAQSFDTWMQATIAHHDQAFQVYTHLYELYGRLMPPQKCLVRRSSLVPAFLVAPGFHSIVQIYGLKSPQKRQAKLYELNHFVFQLHAPGVLLEATQCCYLPLAYSSISARIARLDWYWHSFGHCRKWPPNCPLCPYACCSIAPYLGTRTNFRWNHLLKRRLMV